MKNTRINLFVGACFLAGLSLFTGCKSGTAPVPVKEPVPAPAVTEPQRSPDNLGKESPKTQVPPVVAPANASDAQGLLKQSAERSLNAKSVASEIEMDIEMLGMKMTLTFSIAKNGDLTYTSGEFMGMRFEGYADGEKMVMQDPMSRKWMRVPPEQKDMMMSLEQVQRKIYGDYLQKAVFADEETVEGKLCQVIDATVKPEVFNDILANQNNPMMQGMEVNFDKTTVRIWIEKSTGFIYKTVINMEATMTGDIPGMGGQEDGNDIEDEEEAEESKTPAAEPKKELKTTKIKYEIEINNSDYNNAAPVIIPDEVKKLLETPVIIEPANK